MQNARKWNFVAASGKYRSIFAYAERERDAASTRRGARRDVVCDVVRDVMRDVVLATRNVLRDMVHNVVRVTWCTRSGACDVRCTT